MIAEFRLPDLGEGLTEAEVVQWLVAPGDSVALNQTLAEVETAKAVVELPSPYEGTVSTLHADAGETVAVGAPLIAFDIDRFKEVNDRYGHPVGDIALRTVAEAAQKLVRSSDIVVRSGGEDFQVIAPHTSAIDGLKMAEKLRVAIASTLIPGCDQVTVSLGVAQLGDQESADSLTVRVNAALARAKRAGRNCVELAMQ